MQGVASLRFAGLQHRTWDSDAVAAPLRRTAWAGALLLAAMVPVRAEDASPTDSRGLLERAGALQDALEADGWLVHGQTTYIVQDRAQFRSPYRGPLSLTSDTRARMTLSADAVLGRKLWQGGEFFVSPELDIGSGLNNSTGVAGALNNEAFRLSSADPKITIPRLFLRQTFGLGGAREHLDADQLQFAESVDVERITVTGGKVSVWDIFDQNSYAHDARTQFINWALVGNGAIDFAADARGYTVGAAAEYNRADFAARLGAFQVARDVNGKHLDDHVFEGWQILGELEERFRVFERPAKLRELVMLDRTRSITYQAYPTLAPISASDPLPALRRYREAYGLGLNYEQELATDLGFFARLSYNPGKVQEFMFTEIDRHASLGVSLKGGRWDRPDDTLGFAGLINGLSDHHRAFNAAGNVGFIIGDGRLNYKPEEILETYYDFQLLRGVTLMLDYQFVANPGYNADRGPVSVFAFRFHAEF
jgi:high affinity Mn2+ porin